MENAIREVDLSLSDPLVGRLALQLIITLASLLFLGYCYKRLPNRPLTLTYGDRVFSLGLRGQKRALKFLVVAFNSISSYLLLDEFIPNSFAKVWPLVLVLVLSLIFNRLPKGNTR